MSGPRYANAGAVLAPVNAAFRAASGGGLWASIDHRCARRLPKARPGRRNAARPNRETAQLASPGCPATELRIVV
jgi:hypothetical protein